MVYNEHKSYLTLYIYTKRLKAPSCVCELFDGVVVHFELFTLSALQLAWHCSTRHRQQSESKNLSVSLYTIYLLLYLHTFKFKMQMKIWNFQYMRRIQPIFCFPLFSTMRIGMASLIYGYEKRTITNLASAEIVVSLQVLGVVTIIFSLFGGFRSFLRLLSGIFPGVSERIAERRTEKPNV